MSTNVKKIDLEKHDKTQSHDVLACANDSQIIDAATHDESGKKKHERKLLLLILLMILAVTQIIVLLANSGFINRSPEPVTLTEIKEVNTDLKKVIKDLDELSKNPDLKDDHVDVKEVVFKPTPMMPAPAPIKKKEPVKIVVTKPAKKTVEKKAIVLVVAAPAPIPVVSVVKVVTPQPDYIKHDIDGKSLEKNNETWSCVHDTKGGLMWEVKSKDDPMRNSNNLYSWFNPSGDTLKGVTDGGHCKGAADCDTHAYIKEMNIQNYCGHNDWRLPTREEMMGLVSYANGSGKVKINTNYFPHALPSWYWTASSNESRPEFAWYVLFKNGMSLNDLKENPKHIRLVRSLSSS